MLNAIIIGHLGADAVLQNANGKEFVSFRVAHSEKFTDSEGQQKEQTTWVDCLISGKPAVTPYLLKGTMVYVQGAISLRVYDSAKYHCKMAGISCRVRDVQLLSAKQDNNADNQTADNANNDRPF